MKEVVDDSSSRSSSVAASSAEKITARAKGDFGLSLDSSSVGFVLDVAAKEQKGEGEGAKKCVRCSLAPSRGKVSDLLRHATGPIVPDKVSFRVLPGFCPTSQVWQRCHP